MILILLVFAFIWISCIIYLYMSNIKKRLVQEPFNDYLKTGLRDVVSSIDVGGPELDNLQTQYREKEWDYEYLEQNSNNIPMLNNKLANLDKDTTKTHWSNLENTVICDLEAQMCDNAGLQNIEQNAIDEMIRLISESHRLIDTVYSMYTAEVSKSTVQTSVNEAESTLKNNITKVQNYLKASQDAGRTNLYATIANAAVDQYGLSLTSGNFSVSDSQPSTNGFDSTNGSLYSALEATALSNTLKNEFTYRCFSPSSPL